MYFTHYWVIISRFRNTQINITNLNKTKQDTITWFKRNCQWEKQTHTVTVSKPSHFNISLLRITIFVHNIL